MSGEATLLARYPSKSNPMKIHDVIKGADGVIYCTCPAWRFRKDCAHIDRYRIDDQDLKNGKNQPKSEDDLFNELIINLAEGIKHA